MDKLYRRPRAEVFSVNALAVLKKRYLLKNDQGEVIETPAQLFRRVAKAIAAVDERYGCRPAQIRRSEEEFYQLMTKLEFLPNTPTLMNAGTEIGQLSACFVVPVPDALEGIFEAVKIMALIQQSGGGTGFSFSRLRPRGDGVKTTHGVASGPVSFMKVFDATTEIIKQGGRRRGANMGILRVDHPDILEFITSKEKESILTNFNISVGVTDSFMRKVKEDKTYELISPRTEKPTAKLRAREVFELITTLAWRTGDPGLVFLDEINRCNPTPRIGKIEATNPCGEQPLLPYESCNLGSINLAKMFTGNSFDFKKLRQTVEKAVHFLDNVIDANRYPILPTREITLANRKIGLGIMGFAEMLIHLGIPYDSKNALAWGSRIMKFIRDGAWEKSKELGKQRGSFPNFSGSIWAKRGFKHFRNATVTTIAPTGTISIIANCTSGIEPLFAVSYIREVMEGAKLLETNAQFEKIALERGFYSKELMRRIAKSGNVQQISEVPQALKKIFVTALDIASAWQVRMQAAFQKYTDNAVSKTVNLPENATVDEVRRIFWLAWQLKCKGITIYRYGSKREQVLYRGSYLSPETGEKTEQVRAESEYSGGCPIAYCPF